MPATWANGGISASQPRLLPRAEVAYLHSHPTPPPPTHAYRSLGRPVLGVDQPFIHLAPHSLGGKEGDRVAKRRPKARTRPAKYPSVSRSLRMGSDHPMAQPYSA